MQIDPRVAFWFGVWTSLLLLVGGGTVNLTHVFPDAWIPTINAWCVFLGTINSVVLTALNGYSSAKPGPLVTAPPLPPAVKAVLAWFVVLIVSLIFVLPAMAANTVPVPAPRPAAAKLTTTQAQANPLAVLQQVSISDLQAALDDATAQNDAVSAPCWQALLTAAQQQQVAAPVLPSGVFSAIQKGRDLKVAAANALSSTGPLSKINIACAPLIIDANATLLLFGVSTGLVVGSGGIALPALPGFLPLLLGLAPK